MKDEIKIVEIDEDSCECKAISKHDNKAHIFKIPHWVLLAYINHEYEVEIKEITDGCIEVFSFREIPKKTRSWFH